MWGTRSHQEVTDQDPRAYVEAPVVDALNGIVLRATIGFAVVAGFASVPLIFELPPVVHEAFHLVLPVGAVAYAVATAALLLLRPAPPEADPWRRAAEVDRDLARFARRVSTIMVLGWLLAVGAVLVHHHLASPRDVLATVLVDVPLSIAVWLAAAVAWGSWARASLARAEHAAEGRLRRYWSRVPHSQRSE